MTDAVVAHLLERGAWGFPRIAGRCPSCGSASLFLGAGAHVTCSVIGCTDPSAADDYLHDGPAPAATPPPLDDAEGRRRAEDFVTADRGLLALSRAWIHDRPPTADEGLDVWINAVTALSRLAVAARVPLDHARHLFDQDRQARRGGTPAPVGGVGADARGRAGGVGGEGGSGTPPASPKPTPPGFEGRGA